ncbi:MAG: acid--CoA ligase, partial [Gammaproteobacteria bacterium]
MEPISLSRIVAWWAERQPDAPAVTHESRTLTWSEFDARTNRLARAYAERGVQADDFVTIALPNGIAFFEATFATWKLGATPQPVSAKLPAAELGRLLEVGQPRLVVGVEASAHPEANTLPADFEPDPALSDAELPERTATSFKAMTSGGSTGRPKLIV